MIGLTASTAASSTDTGRNQGRDDPDVTASHKIGGITHDEYRRMRELMFNEDVPEMERSSSSSSMLSVSSTSSCTSSLSTASSSKRRIFGPFWDGRRVDCQEDSSSASARAAAARGCHDWGLGVVGGGGGMPPPPAGSHPFISSMSSTGSSRTLSYEARASFANMAFDRISAFEAGGGMYSEAGTSSVDDVPNEARRASLADADQGGSASYGESTQPTERCSVSQDRHGHEKNSSGDRDRRSIFTSSSFSQPPPPRRRQHFLDRPEFRKERSASFTHRSIGIGSMFPSDPNQNPKGDVVRRSSLRSKGESSSSSRSDPNLRASVHFDPRVRVVEFRPSEVQHAGNGWSRWFTYN